MVAGAPMPSMLCLHSSSSGCRMIVSFYIESMVAVHGETGERRVLACAQLGGESVRYVVLGWGGGANASMMVRYVPELLSHVQHEAVSDALAELHDRVGVLVDEGYAVNEAAAFAAPFVIMAPKQNLALAERLTETLPRLYSIDIAPQDGSQSQYFAAHLVGAGEEAAVLIEADDPGMTTRFVGMHYQGSQAIRDARVWLGLFAGQCRDRQP
jgi:hypothetical protein